MKSKIISIIFLLSTIPLSAQESINLNISEITLSSDSIWEFQTIKEAIGEARIVLLGEQTHYDGATFEARIALTKYLHEALGFDVVAFESGMYGIDKANRNLKNGEAPQGVFSRENFTEGVMGLWIATKEFQEFVKFIDSNSEIEVAGFDGQITSEYTKQKLVGELKEFLSLDKTYKWDKQKGTLLTETIFEISGGDFKYFTSKDAVSINQLFAKTEKAIGGLETEFPVKSAFWKQWIKSTKATLAYMLKESKGYKYKAQNPRDAQMADNLIFLSKKYPSKKIIAWGASYHFAHNMDALDLNNSTSKGYLSKMARQQDEDDEGTSLQDNLEGTVPMGAILKQKLGNEIYTIGFTAHEGTWGYDTDSSWLFPVITPPENSLENTVNALHYAHAFVDLKQSKKSKAYFCSALGYLPLKAKWDKLFDGIYYIKKMHPSTSFVPGGYVFEKNNAPSKHKYSGKITDLNTGAPISFANVSIKGTSIGTATNSNGYFEIFLPKESLNSNLIFSSIGYSSVSIPITSLKIGKTLSVKLKPSVYALQAITITAPLSEQQIVKKVLKNIERNYPQFPHSMDIFYRYKYKKNNALESMDEAAIEFYDSEGYKRGGWAKISNRRFLKVVQRRKSGKGANKKEQTNLSTMWTTWSHDPILTAKNIFSQGREKNYALQLKGIKTYKNRQVYHIQFNCLKPNNYNIPYGYPSPAIYKGDVFIDTENFALLKYAAYTKWDVMKMEKKKFLKRQGFQSPVNMLRSVHDVFYYDEYDGSYYLKYASSNYKIEFETIASKEKSIREYIDQILVTKIEAKNPKKLTETMTKVGINIDYDKNFWDSYNIMLDEGYTK